MRLRHAGDERYLERRGLVVDQWARFMTTIPPLHLAFLPSFLGFLCQNRGLACAVAMANDPENQTLNEQTREAISRLGPELETEKRERAAILRGLLPEEDTYDEGATDEQVLSLATSVYTCISCDQTMSGLHTLAHHCYGPRTQGPELEFSDEGRITVEMLLDVMGLGKETGPGKETTELEMDRREDRFVCVGCSMATYGGIRNTLPCIVRDWRSCVSLVLRYSRCAR
jgi:hypothetical protein